MANESGCDNALLGTSQEYYASGNLSWLEVTGLLNPGIPVNKAGVEMYRNMFSGSAPTQMPLEVEVAVPAGMKWQDLTFPLKIVSPEEPVHGFILAVHDAILRGDDHETLMCLVL